MVPWRRAKGAYPRISPLILGAERLKILKSLPFPALQLHVSKGREEEPEAALPGALSPDATQAFCCPISSLFAGARKQPGFGVAFGPEAQGPWPLLHPSWSLRPAPLAVVRGAGEGDGGR